jgi:hypothetical protein
MSVDYVQIAMNGLFTGIGVAIGTYLANKHFIEKMEKGINNIKDRIKAITEVAVKYEVK